MRTRNERRANTIRVAEQARDIHVYFHHPQGITQRANLMRPLRRCRCETSLWFYAKRSSLGCRCRRRVRGAPKLASGMCHWGERGYHPSTAERITGNRLCRAWERAIRSVEPDDVDL